MDRCSVESVKRREPLDLTNQTLLPHLYLASQESLSQSASSVSGMEYE